jgi:hypothetical protein
MTSIVYLVFITLSAHRSSDWSVQQRPICPDLILGYAAQWLTHQPWDSLAEISDGPLCTNDTEHVVWRSVIISSAMA